MRRVVIQSAIAVAVGLAFCFIYLRNWADTVASFVGYEPAVFMIPPVACLFVGFAIAFVSKQKNALSRKVLLVPLASFATAISLLGWLLWVMNRPE